MIAREKGHEDEPSASELTLNTAGLAQASRAELPPAARVGLSWLDKMALTGLVSEEPTPLTAWVQESATALAGPDRDGARLRLLARATASARAKVALLEAMLDERLAARDDAGVALVDRALTSATRRLAMMLAEHRASCTAERRSTVLAVAHVDNITVRAGSGQ